MLTDFGKIIRLYRIEHGLLLKDMANKLGYPSSYLSAMEMGRKSVPDAYLEKLFDSFVFAEEEKIAIKKAASNSVSSVKLDLNDVENSKRNLAICFARKFDGLSEAQISGLLKYLNKDGDDS